MLSALDALDLAENTLVVFTSDHGEMLGDHGLTQKFVQYRESIGVPLAFRLPGAIPAGRMADEPTSLTDLFSTLLDYAGVESAAPTGPSLRPLLEGRHPDGDRCVFSQFERWNVMAQNRGWKYVWSNRPGDVDMLFDLANDSAETTNLVGANPDRATKLEQAEAMKQALVGWMEQTQHPWLADVVRSPIG